MDIEKLEGAIHCEGFDYAFSGYSEWHDIKDKEFHKLRKNFLLAREKLRNYINGQKEANSSTGA